MQAIGIKHNIPIYGISGDGPTSNWLVLNIHNREVYSRFIIASYDSIRSNVFCKVGRQENLITNASVSFCGMSVF